MSFEHWLLEQEVGYLEFLRAIYELDRLAPKGGPLMISYWPPPKSPITESEIQALKAHLNNYGLNGII